VTASNGSLDEPIAIVGMVSPLPRRGGQPGGLWRLLEEGRDAISEIPPDRWHVDRYYDPEPGVPGKMYAAGRFPARGRREFDASFRDLAARGSSMDPQQRLRLVSWAALEDAAIVPTGWLAAAPASSSVFLHDYARHAVGAPRTSMVMRAPATPPRTRRRTDLVFA
jgi:acyl transferase domain-containing protein